MNPWTGLITTLVLASFGYTFTVAQENDSAKQQIQEQQQANTDAIRYLILQACLKEHPQEECLKLLLPSEPPAQPGQ